MFKPGDYVIYHGFKGQDKSIQRKWFGTLMQVVSIVGNTIRVRPVYPNKLIKDDIYGITGLSKFTLVDDYEPV